MPLPVPPDSMMFALPSTHASRNSASPRGIAPLVHVVLQRADPRRPWMRMVAITFVGPEIAGACRSARRMSPPMLTSAVGRPWLSIFWPVLPGSVMTFSLKKFIHSSSLLNGLPADESWALLPDPARPTCPSGRRDLLDALLQVQEARQRVHAEGEHPAYGYPLAEGRAVRDGISYVLAIGSTKMSCRPSITPPHRRIRVVPIAR